MPLAVSTPTLARTAPRRHNAAMKITTISSRDNAAFKRMRDLVGSSRERRAQQTAWLEGQRLCAEYLKTADAQACTLVASASLAVDDLLRSLAATFSEVLVLDTRLFAELTQLDSPSGWALLIPIAQTVSAQNKSLSGDVLILDRVQDPGNAGSIMRSAVAAGVAELWCVNGTVDVWSPKVLRAAMGAHFSLSVLTSIESDLLMTMVRDRGLKLLATANSPDAVSLYSNALDLGGTNAWVFGREGEGVSTVLLNQAVTVVIPQSEAIESINVAVAAGICLFETRRRRLAGTKPA